MVNEQIGRVRRIGLGPKKWMGFERGPDGVHGFEGRHREIKPLTRIVQTPKVLALALQKDKRRR